MPFGKRQSGPHRPSDLSGTPGPAGLTASPVADQRLGRAPVRERSYAPATATAQTALSGVPHAAPNAALAHAAAAAPRGKRAASGKMALLAPERALEVADDLAHFFGRNADIYLHTYTKMVERQRLVVIGWHWPLFFIFTIWMFYRRLWIPGALLAALPFLLTPLGTGAVPALLGVVLSLSVIMKALYVNEGLKRIVEADAMGLTGPQRMTWLMRRGGVSMAAAMLVIILYVVIGAVMATTAVTAFLAQQQAAQGGMDAGVSSAPVQRAPRPAEDSVPR